MKKFNINLTICLLVLVVLLNGFLIYKIFSVNRQMIELSEKLEKKLTEQLTEQISVHSKSVDENFNFTNQKLDVVYEKQIGEIAGVRNNISKMKRTYDSILETEKQTRVDNSVFDISMKQKIDEGKQLFNKGKYYNALEIFKSVLDYDNQNIDARLYKMLSTFNINKMNSSVYAEILSDCKVLKESGCTDGRINEVESFILQEQQ